GGMEWGGEWGGGWRGGGAGGGQCADGSVEALSAPSTAATPRLAAPRKSMYRVRAAVLASSHSRAAGAAWRTPSSDKSCVSPSSAAPIASQSGSCSCQRRNARAAPRCAWRQASIVGGSQIGRAHV